MSNRLVAAYLLQGGSAEALHAACATPDNAVGSGGPLLRGQLRSPARDGADEVAAEVLLPCSDAGSGLDAALQKARPSPCCWTSDDARGNSTRTSGRLTACARSAL